jgi:predicted transglutaminase-like cysteine proteinase
MTVHNHRWLLGLIISIGMAISWPLLAEFNVSQKLLDDVEHSYNKFARQRVADWQLLIDSSSELPDIEKLERVNAFFNGNVQFINDQALWGKKDYWATPIEMLSIGGGDCEDYAVGKYFTLRRLGIDEDKLRLTYVKAVELGQAHMVLTYFENKRAIPLVLDNLIIDIKPANQRQDLIPVYSFNGEGLWLAKRRGNGQRVGNASRLSLWEDLIFRINNGE